MQVIQQFIQAIRIRNRSSRQTNASSSQLRLMLIVAVDNKCQQKGNGIILTATLALSTTRSKSIAKTTAPMASTLTKLNKYMAKKNRTKTYSSVLVHLFCALSSLWAYANDNILNERKLLQLYLSLSICCCCSFILS